jgi:predicted unusual protein kinase regulating ubiquinone biosynthesis (AarF/ABC1/UbiB family)
MPPELAVDTITAELGRSPGEAFAQFDPSPLAAASIGQVHAATMHDGRRVAVKVQYPGVAEAIRADLANTELLATFLQLVLTVAPGLARVDVRDMAREVSMRIGEEVDYRVEAANQQEFADLYRGHPFIRVPEVVPELSTSRLLVTDLSDGLRYATAITAEQSLRERWGEAIHRFVVANLSRGLFNADPHPGNYLFHPDGSVTFLDFGCVKRFSAEQVPHMDALIDAVIDGDARAVMRAAIAAEVVDPADPPDAEALLAALAQTTGRPLAGPQPFAYTPEFASEVLTQFNPRGVHGPVVRKINGAGDYVFITRIDTGMTAVLAGLRAVGPWRAIRYEYYRGGPPATPYGEAEAEFRKVPR